MGTVAIVMGIIGICIGWLPIIGWSGVVLGVVGSVLGILSITHWYTKAGYTGWGVSGIVLGITSASLAIAYQIKHAAGALDALYVSVSIPTAAIVVTGTAAAIVIGIVIARRQKPYIGLMMASLAVTLLSISAAWMLTTADRALEKDQPSELAKNL